MLGSQEAIHRLRQQADAYHAHQALIRIAPDAILVGGAVRDLLQDRDLHDLDYVLEGDALSTTRRLGDELGGAYYPLDERRGIGRVVWQTSVGDRMVIDVAASRGGSLDEDLLARDFTINAIAMNADGSLYDPLSGIDDLSNGVLRACTRDSLHRDPVRILRAVRFIYQFRLQADTALVGLVGSAMSGLDLVSPERQRDELLKILALPEPQKTLNTLLAWRLEERCFPELTPLQWMEPSPPHVYGVRQHSLVALQWMARIDELCRLDSPPLGDLESIISQELSDYRDFLRDYLNQLPVPDRPWWLWLRFSALAHDWGKAETYSKNEEGRISFLGHEAVSAELAGNWLKRYHCAASEIEFVRQVCRGHMRPISLSNGGCIPRRRSLYRFYRDLGDAAPGVILLHIADHLATFGPTVKPDELQQHLKCVAAMLAPMITTDGLDLTPPTLLNGKDLITTYGLVPGPHIGELLKALHEAQALGEVRNQEQATEWIQKRLR